MAQVSKGCSQCIAIKGSGDNYHRFVFLTLEFDVDKAVRMVKTLSKAAEVVNWNPDHNGIYVNRAHTAHVDPKSPGIMAKLRFKTTGELLILCIDGNHRAARAVQDGTEFSAYWLTEQESYSLLKAGKRFIQKP